MSVVGLPAQVNTKQKKSSFALPSTKGVDPAVTNVVAKPAVTEESSRPDKVTYDVEQAEYKKTMDALLVKQVRISSFQGLCYRSCWLSAPYEGD